VVIEDAGTDTRVSIYQSETDVVVAFRGTQALRNWLTDLDFRFIESNGCKIHAGFWAALDSVYQRINQTVFAPGYKAKRIWLTGHSLGGALAMLYAWRTASDMRDQPFAGIYTFGQPRVGNGSFRDLYSFHALNYCTFRVVHHQDIVTHVPWLCGIYRHCAHEAWYAKDDPGSLCIDRPGWQYGLDDVMALITAKCRPSQIETWLFDHHVANYQKLFSAITLNTNAQASPAAVSAGQAAPEADYSGAPPGAGIANLN
jgi:hypothetical protein